MTDRQPTSRKIGRWPKIAAACLIPAAVGALLLPYYQQWKAVEGVRAVGGGIAGDVSGPMSSWLHERLPRKWSFAVVRVSRIHVDGKQFGDQQLADLSAFRDLRMLRMGQTHVSDAGLRHLANLPKLTVLDLSSTTISDEGLQHLNRLSQLRLLSLEDTQVTPAGIRTLQATLPDCRIVHSHD